MFMSTLDRFHEKADLKNISEYFDDIDDVNFFDVEVQGYDDDVNNINLEELL